MLKNAVPAEEEISQPEPWSPILIVNRRMRRKPVTREKFFTEAHLFFRNLANTMQDLSLPAFETHENLPPPSFMHKEAPGLPPHYRYVG